MYLDHLKGRLLEVRQRKPVVFSSDEDEDDGPTRMPRAIMPPPTPPSTQPPLQPPASSTSLAQPIGAITQQSQEVLAIMLPSPLSPVYARNQDICPPPLQTTQALMPRSETTPKRAAQAKPARGPIKRKRPGPKCKKIAPEVISVSSQSSNSSFSSSSSSHSSSSSSSSGSSSSSESSDEIPPKNRTQTSSPTPVPASKKRKSRKMSVADDDVLTEQREATIKLLLDNLSMLVDNHNKFINAIKQCYEAIAVISEPSKSPLFGRRGKANLRQLNKELNNLKKSK